MRKTSKTSQTKVMATMALVALVVVVLVVLVMVVAARERKRSWANGARCCPRLLQLAGLD